MANTLPDHLQDFIIDHMQFYGVTYFIFATLTKSEIARIQNAGENALWAVYLPQIYNDKEFSHCKQIAVPTIWQGIPGPYEIYLEPVNQMPLELLSNFVEVLKEKEIIKLYSPNHHKKILKYLKYLQTNKRVNKSSKRRVSNNASKQLKPGYLVILDSNEVPYAKNYPMARLLQVTNDTDELNLEIMHQQSKNGKVIDVENSDGWIRQKAVVQILCTSTDREIHFGAYTAQQLQRSRQRAKKYKTEKESRFNHVLTGYFGLKIKKSMNKVNFDKNRKNQKQTTVEQEMNHEDIDELLIKKLNKNSINYAKNSVSLKIVVENARQMGCIIGGNNVMNKTLQYEYFLIYPLEITFGYKLVYPKLKVMFNLGRSNPSNNLEH